MNSIKNNAGSTWDDAETILAANHLNKSYSQRSGQYGFGSTRVKALDDVSIRLKTGSTLAVVGESVELDDEGILGQQSSHRPEDPPQLIKVSCQSLLLPATHTVVGVAVTVTPVR